MRIRNNSGMKKCAGQLREVKLQLSSTNSLFVCLLPSRFLFWEIIFFVWSFYVSLDRDHCSPSEDCRDERVPHESGKKKFRSP